MGENHKAAGYASAALFVQALAGSEAAHLSSFVAFVDSDPAMRTALQKKHCATFARRYNGKGYRKNRYDTKLQAAYDRLAKSEAAKLPASALPKKLP